ncbi:MAG: LacI family DNA-binding transcriptional regulator [Eubacteriales bacterium]|nr:LacI family DNA-binding transcriptional regulator [Eubacteriales bacterium]
MENKRVRISDIAEELGLSTATVSNVIHGKTKKISDETVRRVQQLLEERQYIPSMAGILLAQNNSRIIGVIINDHPKYEGHVLEDPFIASSLNGLSREIDRSGQFMMVKVTTELDSIIKFASMWNMDGMVLIGFCEQDYKTLRAFMRVPFVVYEGYFCEAGGICNLTIDNRDGGFQVGQYFKRLGHKRALCVADNHICMDWERYQGFLEGFGTDGADFMEVAFEEEKRRNFYEQNLEKIKTYSAVFAVSDRYAVELMRFLTERGVRIPEEISIVGFDDSPICQQVTPALTSVRQEEKERARLAVEKLKLLKENRQEETEVKLGVSLVERDSSAPFGR